MASHDPDRPNIVFILSDDQGQWAAGCYGNTEIRTPAIDALARTGVRFDNFFCASPVCSPARATLLTGRIPSQHGIHDWLREGNMGPDAVEYLVGRTAYTELLAEAGYLVGLSGKWHLGDSVRPQKGHSHWYVHQQGGGPYYGAPMIRHGVPYVEPDYVTDAITRDACEFIDSTARDERPFYLGVHYTAPHSPWIGNHPEDLIGLYESCPFDSCPDLPFHPWANNGVRWGLEKQAASDGWDRTRRANLSGYFAAVTGMDRGVASVCEALRRGGLDASTIVVFTGDNGMNMGHHGVWGKGNGTYPLNMFDSSIKVPFIVRQSGRIRAGDVESSMVSAYDLMPTLLDLVGIDNPEAEALPGLSFADRIMTGETRSSPDSREVVVFDEYGPVRMIRTEEWKYVARSFFGPDELYDLAHDPEESTNLAGDPTRAALMKELRARLDAWFERWVEPCYDGALQPVTGMGQLARLGGDTPPRRCFEPFPIDRM